MMLEMLYELESIYKTEFSDSPIYRHINALQEGVKAKVYQPLMSRTKCSKCRSEFLFEEYFPPNSFSILNRFADSLENRIAHYAKKRRIEVVNKNESDGETSAITFTSSNDDDGNE